MTSHGSAASADAQPLVLLPGMNCSPLLWSSADLGPALTPRLTERSLTRQVDRLLDELPPRFTLAGLSLGAIVAMALVRTAPDRVSRLILMATNPYAPTEQQQLAWRRERDRLDAGATARQLQHDLLPLLLTPETLAERPEVVHVALAMADETPEIELDAQLELQATRIDERPGLRDARCPTLVVAGRHDRLCPMERHTEIASIVPGAALRVLERAAHLSPLEQPVNLRHLISDWAGAATPVS